MTTSNDNIGDVRALLSTANTELPCGADIDELLEQAAEGHADHLSTA